MVTHVAVTRSLSALRLEVARPHGLALAGVAVLTGVVVPLSSWLLRSAWPTAALPLLVLAAGWLWRLERRERQAELELAEARANQATVLDELTACANDTGLRLLAGNLLESARRRGDALYASVVDVDQLGRVNSALGWATGDEVLVAVAEAVRASTRGTDVLARGSDDEFVVVGPGCGVSSGELERRVRAFLVEAPPAPLTVWPCRVTVGQAVLEPWDGADLAELVGRAYQDLSLRSALRSPSAPEPPLPAAS